MSEKKPIIDKISEDREKERKREESINKLLDIIKDWENDGWDVSGLKNKIEDDPSKGEDFIREYKKRIKRLKIIKKRYNSLKLNEFDLAFSENIEEYLNDPDSVKKASRIVNKLKMKIDKKKRLKKLFSKLKELEEEGWDVSGLKAKIKNNPSKGEDLIDEYNKRIERLKIVKKRYQSLPLDKYNMAFSDNIEEYLNDPDSVEKASRIVRKLKKEIKRRKKKKKLLMKAKDWRDEGFQVDKLINTLKDDLDKGEELFSEYEENIKELIFLRKKYSLLEYQGRTLDTVEIEHRLNDPNSVDELRDMIEELEENQVIMEKRPKQEVQTFENLSTEESSNTDEKVMEDKAEKDTTFELDSKDGWAKIIKENRRNKKLFTKIRNEIKYDQSLEDDIVDYLQTDPEWRKNFIYYMEYWNKNFSEIEEAKYFNNLDTNGDFKVLKIHTSSPILGCLYGIGILLEEEKVGISKSTHPHMFFKEYKDKLFGEIGERVEVEEKDERDIYTI